MASPRVMSFSHSGNNLFLPSHLNTSVVGYGAADKEQVQMMVMRLLNLTIKPQADAADALAAAICHAHASGSMSKLTVLNALGGMARGRSRSSSRRR